MLETLRKYWIGLLVLTLVGLHASIVGIIRHQASLAKIDASCEVDLGSYLAFQLNQKAPLQMRLHAIVPINHRMKSRQLIELNQAQIRQSLEEYLRQLDSKLLIDPYLSDLKSHLMEVMIQTIGNSSIEDLVVTELRQSTDTVSLEFVSQSGSNHRRKMVATLRTQPTDEEAAEELVPADEDHADDAHGEGEHTDDATGGDSHTPEPKPHAAAAKPPAKPAHGAHGASDKSHGSASKKPSAHGSTKKPDAKAAHGGGHGGGHGADKKAPAKKSGH